MCAVPMVPELPYPRSSTKERSEALLEPSRLAGLRLPDEQVKRKKAWTERGDAPLRGVQAGEGGHPSW